MEACAAFLVSCPPIIFNYALLPTLLSTIMFKVHYAPLHFILGVILHLSLALTLVNSSHFQLHVNVLPPLVFDCEKFNRIRSIVGFDFTIIPSIKQLDEKSYVILRYAINFFKY